MPSPATTDAPSAFDALDDAADRLLGVDVAAMSPRELLAATARLEQVARRVDAALDSFVAEVERASAFIQDGHRSVTAFLRATCRSSGADASGRAKTVRILSSMPAFATAYRAGSIPVEHVRTVARAAANPRVRDLLFDESVDTIVTEQATRLEFVDFDDWIRSFVALADQDGAEAADDRAHEARSAACNQTLLGSWLVRAQLSSIAGVIFKTVLAAFEEAELAADWADARDRLGDEASDTDLARTAGQRRADALVAMAVAASSASGRANEPVVQLLIDQATFERELARASGTDEGAEPVDPDEVVCRTLAGDRVLARDVVALALAGLVQRVVVDPGCVVINMGRRRRLFTGSAREAALIQAALRLDGRLRCLYPGCSVPGRVTQIDHRAPFRNGGRTDQHNADPKCMAHNRLKEAGFVATRLRDGTWRTIRPDGTPITAGV